MQRVVGEIFKSTCGRRLLAYYWFSILVPSSHHCMTALWSTGASGDTGRGLWSKQVMSQHWHHHPLQKGREETTWKRPPPPILQSESSALAPIPRVFQITGGTGRGQRAGARYTAHIHELWACFQLCEQESSLQRGTAAHETTFPVINPTSCGSNPFWFVQTWVMAPEQQR